MEIEQLRAFLSLSKTMNFSRTGQQLHLVQSAVSTRIRLLEETVGCRLFKRDNRAVELTAAGAALVPFAERILQLREDGIAEARAVEVAKERLAIGSTDSLWKHLFEPVLLQFSKQFPEVLVTTKTGPSWKVLQLLLDGAIQLGLVYEPPATRGVRAIRVYEDDIVLVGSPKLSTKLALAEVSKRDLQRLPWLFIEWDGPFNEWTKSMLPAGYVPSVFPDRLSLLIAFLREGRGFAFVPKRMVRDDLAVGNLKSLPLSRGVRVPKRSTYAIYDPKNEARSSIKNWLALITQHLAR